MKQLAVVYKKNLPNIAEVNEILHVDEKEDQPKEGYLTNLWKEKQNAPKIEEFQPK